MHPPPPAQRPAAKAATGAAPAMEETMQLWTINELMHLTRDELCDLAGRIEGALPRRSWRSPTQRAVLVGADKVGMRIGVLDQGSFKDARAQALRRNYLEIV